MSDHPVFIGRYRVVERIGSGGMGVLYLARDPTIDRRVAIKVAHVQDAELRQRFLREARATGRLDHRNIVTIFDVGEHGGEPFIAMEYVPGRTLAEIVRERAPLPIPPRLRMLRELCEGLAYAHAQGVVHRDVKPANLMVRDDSGALTILDFGIARLADTLTTGDGRMIGTPSYMAPEQIVGGGVDHRCDIFAVGLVCYELLSYRRAFGGDTPTAVTYRIVHEEPTPLRELVPDLPESLLTLVERAIVKRVGDRFQQMSEVLAELDAAIAGVDEKDGREPESTILLPREAPKPAPSTSTSGGGLDREALRQRRNARLTACLDDAQEAIERGRYDDAQEAIDQAALLDPDDARVLQVMARLAAVRRDRQFDEHVSNARMHLKNLALTQASESVDLALQARPESPEALKIRNDVERRRLIDRLLERAERLVAEGAFREAARTSDEVLAIEPGHEAALRSKTRAERAEHDSRALGVVEEARQVCAGGDFAAAHDLLARFAPPHDLVETERATVGEAIQQARKSLRDGSANPLSRWARPGPDSAADAGRTRALDGLTRKVPPVGGGVRGLANVWPSLTNPLAAVAAVVAVAAVATGLWLAPFGGESEGVALDTPKSGFDAGAQILETDPPRREEALTGSGAPDSRPEAGSAPEVRGGDAEDARSVPSPPAAPVAAVRSSPAPEPRGPGVAALLNDAVAAEVAGNDAAALALYARVIERDPDNRTARDGQRRVRTAIDRRNEDRLVEEANAAFADGRYADAGALFRQSNDLRPSPAAAEGLQRAANAAALTCGAGAACGVLAVRTAPAAELFVDDRSLGVVVELVVRLPAGRHRIRLETDAWRYPRVVEIAVGERTTIDVDLAESGFPRPPA